MENPIENGWCNIKNIDIIIFKPQNGVLQKKEGEEEVILQTKYGDISRWTMTRWLAHGSVDDGDCKGITAKSQNISGLYIINGGYMSYNPILTNNGLILTTYLWWKWADRYFQTGSMTHLVPWLTVLINMVIVHSYVTLFLECMYLRSEVIPVHLDSTCLVSKYSMHGWL